MKGLWCSHQWKEKERGYAPTPPGAHAEGLGPDLAREIFFGVTVVLLRCEKCGDLKTLRFAGKVEAGRPSPSASPS